MGIAASSSSAAGGRAGPFPKPAPLLAGKSAARTRSEAAARTEGHTAGRAGSWVVLLGAATSLVGFSWDIEWHKDVGPDTFFTLPHLFVYAGPAVAGIASLVMVLMSTAAQRAGRQWPRTAGGPGVRVFGGVFTAPLGFLVSGTASAAFLLYGLMDLWWHSIYGFDAVLDTPSHTALFMSVTITMIGALIIFAAAISELWARIGMTLAVAVTVIFAPLPTHALNHLSLPFDPPVAGSILFSVLLLIVGAGILGRPGAALAVAAVLGAVQAVLWWFSPWAAHAYAHSTGLPLRDGLPSAPPLMAGDVPAFLGLAAVVVEVAYWLIRTRDNLNATVVMLATAAVCGLIVTTTLNLQAHLDGNDTTLSGGQIVCLGLGCGLIAGYLGARFITMLRAVAPPPAAAARQEA